MWHVSWLQACERDWWTHPRRVSLTDPTPHTHHTHTPSDPANRGPSHRPVLGQVHGDAGEVARVARVGVPARLRATLPGYHPVHCAEVSSQVEGRGWGRAGVRGREKETRPRVKHCPLPCCLPHTQPSFEGAKNDVVCLTIAPHTRARRTRIPHSISRSRSLARSTRRKKGGKEKWGA